jgi:hypothetical protein
MATIEETIELFRGIAPHVDTWIDPEDPEQRIWFVKNPENPGDAGMSIKFVAREHEFLDADGGEDWILSWKARRTDRLRNSPDSYCFDRTQEDWGRVESMYQGTIEGAISFYRSCGHEPPADELLLPWEINDLAVEKMVRM